MVEQKGNAYAGGFIRGDVDRVLKPGAAPPLPPPSRELDLRDAFRTGEDE